MTNQDLAKMLSEMAALYEMEGVEFKPRAYEKAAYAIESLNADVGEIYKSGGVKALIRMPSIGPGIAAHLEEYLKTGHFKEYERLKKKVPVNISELTAVEGVGPRTVKILWEKLKIRNLADLEKTAKAGKIRRIEHFGEKSEQKILKGIELLKKSGGRRILGEVMPDVRQLEKMIQSFPEVKKIVIAGSIRRRKETIGDIDILATSARPEKVMERFLKLPQISHVYSTGKTKTMVKLRRFSRSPDLASGLKNGIDADLRVVPKISFGAALNYFTGSKDHNVYLREVAIKKGYKLNEYGLFRGKKLVASRTEEELYKALGLSYIEPELREMTGEIEAAQHRAKLSFGEKKAKLGTKLPKLIGYDDLKGDLQIQTNWTDGENSIEEMADAAEKAGLEYIAITDHTKALAMTGGSDEKKLLRQITEIEKINAKRKKKGTKLTVLKGAEVNIMKDGSLDIEDKVLAKLDVVGAAVHSHFRLSREEQTKRVIRAMENPHVDVIFHLTGRKINTRDPIDLDIDEVVKAAKRTGTILEIDAYPDRLDIKDEYIRKCVEVGVKMSIDSDSHNIGHLKLLEYGIAQARRGWADKKDIINAWPLEKMLDFLK